MFMLKSTHDRLLADAVSKARAESSAAGAAEERKVGDVLAEVREKTIKRLRDTVATLEAQIAEMQPDAELGRKRRIQYDKDNAKRKEQRKVKAS